MRSSVNGRAWGAPLALAAPNLSPWQWPPLEGHRRPNQRSCILWNL